MRCSSGSRVRSTTPARRAASVATSWLSAWGRTSPTTCPRRMPTCPSHRVMAATYRSSVANETASSLEIIAGWFGRSRACCAIRSWTKITTTAAPVLVLAKTQASLQHNQRVALQQLVGPAGDGNMSRILAKGGSCVFFGVDSDFSVDMFESASRVGVAIKGLVAVGEPSWDVFGHKPHEPDAIPPELLSEPFIVTRNNPGNPQEILHACNRTGLSGSCLVDRSDRRSTAQHDVRRRLLCECWCRSRGSVHARTRCIHQPPGHRWPSLRARRLCLDWAGRDTRVAHTSSAPEP